MRAAALSAVGVGAVLVAIYAATPWWSRSNPVSERLTRLLASSGYLVEFGSLVIGYDLALHAGQVEVREAAAASQQPLLEAESLELLPEFSFASPHVSLSVHLLHPVLRPLQAGPRPRAEVATLPEFGLHPWIAALHLEEAAVDLGSGWTAAGTLAITPSATGLELDFGAARFADGQSRRAGEKLHGTMSLSEVAESGSEPAAPEAADKGFTKPASASGYVVEASLSSGAVLWESLLLDFAEHPLATAALVSRDQRGTLGLSALRFALAGLFSAGGTVGFDRNDAPSSFIGRVEIGDLGTAYSKLIREPFADSYPLLAEVETHGRLSLDLDVRRQSGAIGAVGGRLTGGGLAVTTKAFSVSALEADVPFAFGGGRARGAAAGSLSARDVRVAGLELGDLRLRLRAEPGRIVGQTSLDIALCGGRLRISELVFEEGAAGQLRLRMRAALEGVDLAAASSLLGGPVLDGRVSGDLGEVVLDKASLSVAGAATASVFGGSVRVSGLSVEDPFGRVPTYRLDAAVDEIDLAAMTRALPVGQMSGVLRGHVNDLAWAAGQAQAFDAELHAVRRSGVSQHISVRALVQLAVLGGSNDTSLSGILLRVFDEYRYSRMGMRARLRNDTFELHGIEQQGGRDYLVKGSLLPPSVNVISYSQQISFSELLQRLRRINSVEEGGPPGENH